MNHNHLSSVEFQFTDNNGVVISLASDHGMVVSRHFVSSFSVLPDGDLQLGDIFKIEPVSALTPDVMPTALDLQGGMAILDLVVLVDVFGVKSLNVVHKESGASVYPTTVDWTDQQWVTIEGDDQQVHSVQAIKEELLSGCGVQSVYLRADADCTRQLDQDGVCDDFLCFYGDLGTESFMHKVVSYQINGDELSLTVADI